MLTIYKNKKDIPTDKEYVELNDLFFKVLVGKIGLIIYKANIPIV